MDEKILSLVFPLPTYQKMSAKAQRGWRKRLARVLNSGDEMAILQVTASIEASEAFLKIQKRKLPCI